MALQCRCGNVAEWMRLRIDGFQVTARCAECGIQVAGVDPRELETALEIDAEEPNSPYQTVAPALRDQIAQGELQPGEPIPTVKQLAETYGVAWTTAQRAVKLLADHDLVVVRSGVRTTVCDPRAAN